MKKLTGLVVIIAILILASYYGMGYLTERKVKENLTMVNQSNGLTAEVENYKRGWFTSEALLKWNLHIPEHIVTAASGQSETVPAQDFQMQMPITIYHGPVIFADKTVKFGFGYAHTHLTLPPKYSEQFNNLFSSESTQPKLDLSMFVNYVNNTSIDISIPAFKLIAKQGNGRFDWLGMTSATNLSSNLDKINGNITIDGARISKDQTQTTMSTITSEYNLHKTNSGLYLGDASLSFPSLVVTNNGNKIFELDQFDVHSDTNIEKGLFSSHFKTSLEKVAVNGKIYGPGNLDVAIRNLDADVLAKIHEQVNQVQQGSDVEQQKALLAILPELPRLFSRGAEFEITEMNFVMPQGTIEGNFMVSLPPKTDVANPFELLQKIQGNGKLKVPAVVLKEFITASIAQKLMTPQPPETIQQGIVQQMQQQQAAGETTNSQKTETTSTSTAQTAPTEGVTNPATANPAEVAQQAATLADKQLASMVQSGILSIQGSDYVVEMNLNQGQLMINGKPFNSTMLKFQ